MDKDTFKREMREKFREKWESEHRRKWGGRGGRGHIWAGLFLMVAGGLLLLRATGTVFPAWFFTWPVLLMALGLMIGIRHRLKRGPWMVMVLVGGLFFYDMMNPGMNLRPMILPVALIAVGLIFIFRPKRRCFPGWEDEHKGKPGDNTGIRDESADTAGQEAAGHHTAGNTPHDKTDRGDFIDITSVFGGVKKNVLTKTLKGGDVICFMGGAEINLTQADFSGRVKMDVTNIFGGTKLVIPSDWDVQSEVVAIFGGVDDKRLFNGQPVNPGKVLVLDGTCLFGGIEIRNF